MSLEQHIEFFKKTKNQTQNTPQSANKQKFEIQNNDTDKD